MRFLARRKEMLDTLENRGRDCNNIDEKTARGLKRGPSWGGAAANKLLKIIRRMGGILGVDINYFKFFFFFAIFNPLKNCWMLLWLLWIGGIGGTIWIGPPLLLFMGACSGWEMRVFLRKAEKLTKPHFHSTLEQARSISQKNCFGKVRGSDNE